MHLRHLADGQARYVHALVQLRLAQDDQRTRALAAGVGQGLLLWSELDGVTLSKRVLRRPEGGLSVTYQVLAPARHEPLVRQGLGALAALGSAAVPVAVPGDEAAFAQALDDAPAWHALQTPASYRAGQLWFAWPLRAAHIWGRQASVPSARVGCTGYQTNLYSFHPTVPVLREVAVNHERQQQTRGVPPALLQLQAERLRQARAARWLAEDLLLADGPAAAAELQQHAATLLSRQPGVKGAPTLPAFDQGSCSDALALACGYDEVWAEDPAYVATQAIDNEGAVAWLALDADLPAARAPTHLWAPRQARPGGAEAFIFISYAHADAAQAHLVQGWMAQHRLPYWFDGDLVAGDTWSAMLEQRLRDCAGVLLLLSPQAAASRHVRRELQFADHLAKPMLCLRLQDTTLSDGLAMLLLPLQWLDQGQPDTESRLTVGLQRLLAAGA